MYPLRSTPCRRTRRRCRPRVDHLEERALLSTVPAFDPPPGTFGVTQMDPAPGSVLTQSPSTVTVTFNLPVDPFSLGFADFGLDQVNADGSLTPLDPYGFLGLVTEVGVSGTSPNSVVLDINQALPTGQYEVMLLGSTMIAGLDASYNDVFWSPPNGFGTDTPIGGFTIATPGVTVAQATNLGTVGSSTVATLGALDLGADSSAVSLYQFTLAPGNTWLFGAEIWASRINSPLKTTLSLFSDVNGQGELVKTATVGGVDSPNDPYLFAGLQPGTYYIGVSGAGNVPGTADGYDPFAGIAGVSTATVGGTYELDLAAVPQNTPTEVQNFALNYADSLSTTPTGFTVSFSRPIDESTLASDPLTALDVVDQSGKAWGITPVAANAAGTQFTFVFNQPLPPGQYALDLPAQGGMTDLAGFSPVAAAEPAGVLARWAVEPSVAPLSPYDLGVVYPKAGANIQFSTVVSPGAAASYQLVLLGPADLALGAVSQGGAISVQLTGPNTKLEADGVGALAIPSTSPLVHLGSGVYHITLTALGNGSASIAMSLYVIPKAPEYELSNGVSQGPALNLLFVSPAETSPTGQTATSPQTGSTSALSVTVSATGGNAPAVNISATPAVPSAPAGLIVTIGGSLAGTLGPLAVPTAVSLPSSASTGDGAALATAPPTQSIPLRAGNPTSSSAPEDVPADEDDEVHVAGVDGALVPEVAPVVPSRDAQVLADGAWITRFAERIRGWVAFFRPSAAASVTEIAAAPAVETAVSPRRLALQRDDLPPPETEHRDRADIGLPLGIGVASLAALRLRRPIRRWWRARCVAQNASGPRRGPHRSF